MYATEAGQPEITCTDEEFFALVCSDQELLRAEFDAIIEAGWNLPPVEPERSSEPPVIRGPLGAPTKALVTPEALDQREQPRSPP